MPVGLEHGGHVDALGQVEATRHTIGHVELCGDRHSVGGTLAHSGHHLAGEARPVLERSTPSIGPLVEPGAQERAQEIVVPEVDLDAVEPGLGGDRR